VIDFQTQRYAFLALAAAALFGASTPMAKLLLADVSPVMLAGLLYLGSGLGLVLWRLGASVLHPSPRGRGDGGEGKTEKVSASRAQIYWLAVAILCGGVLAPIFLLWGLARISAANAALLLNLESVATTVLAAFIFSEQVGKRVWIATLLMLAAGAALAWQPGAGLPLSLGALAIVVACVFWGLDNNFTRKISGGDAMQIAMAKGLAAGAVNVVIAVSLGNAFPPAGHLVGALLLGAFAYGVSLVLYVRALRHLGSARTGAHFATAPFVGAAIALALGDHPGLIFVPALALMVIATWLLLTERHAHRHAHEPLSHSHEHVHDEHHHHAHDPSVQLGQPHTHLHEHEALTHFHPHLPDLHHRHTH